MPRLGQEEYLQLFNKIYEDHSFKGEDICKYDRFIYDVFSSKELEIYKELEDYDYYFDSFYTVLFQSEMAMVEPILKDYIKNKIFSVENGYLNFDGVEG
ncbi:hypothetical protein LU065_004648 [Salmonella enterica]|nr:hypothetical protein [Salmonella enterica]